MLLNLCAPHTRNFNPRPREEGDFWKNLLKKEKANISIHALVKRATAILCPFCKIFLISIHALVKRATCLTHFTYSIRLNFNPRPREEGDVSLMLLYLNLSGISIHALVKRATLSCDNIKFNKNISIHALVKRATQRAILRICATRISIHALVKRAT